MQPEIKTILYATDLSDNARHAFGYAVDLAEKYNSKIEILHVMENLNHSMEVQVSELLGPDRWKKLKEDKRETLKQTITDRVHSFCSTATPDEAECEILVTDIHIRQGLPWEEILIAEKEMGADLIVMGTHGYSAIKDAFIGSTARKVVKRSKVPVMIIRLPEN